MMQGGWDPIEESTGEHDESRHQTRGPMGDLSSQCGEFDPRAKIRLREGAAARGHGGVGGQHGQPARPEAPVDLVGGKEQRLRMNWGQSGLAEIALLR